MSIILDLHILRHVHFLYWNPAIFRILAYLEPKIYLEPCQDRFLHIQNSGHTWRHSKSTFSQDSRVLNNPPLFIIPPPSALVCPCSFLSNPILPTSPPLTHHTQGTFVLAKTHPLPPSCYTCEI